LSCTKANYNKGVIMQKVRCKSGIMGWSGRLQDNYVDFDQFKYYASMYGLHTRLGYKTIKGAWKANPLFEGSVIPSDFRRVE